MSERWRNLSTKGKIIRVTKIVTSALGVAGVVAACTPIDASAPGVDKSTPPPTDTSHVAPPPTEAPAQIDYFANTEDGISAELQSKVDQYLKTNDPNGKLEGGFSVVVDDGNDSTSPVEREFAITTDSSGELRIVIDNSQGTRALVPDSITNEGSTKQVDPITGLPIFTYETDPKNSPADFVLNYYPYLDLGQLPNIKQMPIPIHIPNDSLGNLARKAESPALDSEAWNQYGNTVVKNENTKVNGKQIVVNSELSGQFGESVFKLCNQYTFLAEMANEIQKRENRSPLSDAKYQSFNNYMDLVIKPAITQGTTLEGSHFVGHEKRASKSPEIGMVEPMGNFNPSKCSVKIIEQSKVYPNGPVIDAGAFQIGMNLINKDGETIRELVIAIDQTRKNGYDIFYANDQTTVNEDALAHSQMLSTVFGQFDNLANMIPGSENSTYISQFVLGKSTGSKKAEMMFSVPGTAGLDKIKDWSANSPQFLKTP